MINSERFTDFDMTYKPRVEETSISPFLKGLSLFLSFTYIEVYTNLLPFTLGIKQGVLLFLS